MRHATVLSPDTSGCCARRDEAPHDRGVTISAQRSGIRVVRALARDEHVEVSLVRLEGAHEGAAALARPLDERGARMLRVEIAALDRGRGEGVVELIDVIDDVAGVGLLRAHVTGPRLASVLAERERWEAGEAVSVLRPIAVAIGRLHAAGVAHGALSAAAIVVDHGGATLVDFVHAELFARGAPEVVLSHVEGVGSDRGALRDLAGDILSRVAGSRAHAAHRLASDVTGCAASEVVPTLIAALDELAAPVPLATHGRDAVPSSPEQAATHTRHGHAPARLVPVVAPAAIGPEPSAGTARTLSGVAAWLGTTIETARRRLDSLSRGRRRLVVGAGAAIAAGAVLLALPPHEPARDAQHDVEPSLAPVETASPVQRAVISAIEGDDPLAAVTALLARRDECIAELSLLCLEEVDQAGSAALSTDRAGVQALRDGREAELPAADPADVRIVERLGGSVLIEFGSHTHPASLLIMKSEAGWRIRDWIASGD